MSKTLLFIGFVTLIIPPALGQESLCQFPELHTSGSHYELLTRIETPLIPAITDISNAMPAFTELRQMSYLTHDPDAMKQFASLEAPPKEIAPLIMIHPNTERRRLYTVEIAAISSSDCIPGYVEYWGKHVVCKDHTLGRNPFSGEYLFRYFQMQGGAITEVIKERRTFLVSNDSFLPVHNQSLNTDGYRDESEKLIARGLIVDVSSQGIIPDPEHPSYVSIQYIPTEHPNATTEKADKFIYLPFSQTPHDRTLSCPNDTDIIRIAFQDQIVDQTVISGLSNISHFAASYTLSSEANLQKPHIIRTCSDLQALNGTLFTTIELEDDIACDEDNMFTPIQMAGPFTLNGHLHKISGITINSHEDDIGLFSTIPAGSTIANLQLKDINIRGGSRVGSLAGSTQADVNILNIDVTRSHIGGDLYLGGLVGMTGKGSRLENIFTSVEVEGTGLIGGTVGYMYASSASNITVSAYLKGFYNLGEILGGERNSTITTFNPLATKYYIQAKETIRGDHDRNGKVDQSDYDIWKEQFGLRITPPGFGGDSNGDGNVNSADYTVWRNNLGASQ